MDFRDSLVVTYYYTDAYVGKAREYMEKFSVKKPFTILVMVVAIIILGFVSLSGMTTDLLPKMSLPYLLVITTYPGASPEKVESSVSEPVESALGSISGVKNVYSMSYENYGIVELEFADGTDMDSAMVKVSSALDSVKSALPEECGSPNIMEISMDMMASVYLAASYEGKDIQETSRFVEDTLIPYLERQEGVTSISDIGVVENSISVDLNQDKIDALNEKILAKTNDAFADAVDQLNDAKQQLLESEQKLADSTQELVDGQKDIDEGRTKLDDAQKELDEQKEKLEDAKGSLEDQKKDTENKLATASQALDQLNALQTDLLTLQAQEASLKATITAIDGMASTKNDREIMSGGLGSLISFLQSPAASGLKSMDYATAAGTLAGLGIDIKSLGIADEAAWDALTQEQWDAALKKTADGYQSQKDMLDGYDDYVSSLNSLQVEKAGVQAAVSTAEAELKKSGVSYTDIEKAKIEAAAGFGAASAQISSGQSALNSAQTTLDSNKESLDSAQDQITEGWDSIADAKKQLADGWDQYNTSLENFEVQKAEALRNANADQLVNMQTLSQLIYAQNFAMPAGYLDDAEDNSWLLKVGSNYESVDELSNIVLTNIEDIGDVRLCDVADITVIDNADDSYARLNGQSAVVLSVFKSSTAGTNEVSKNIAAAISELEEQYPGLSVLTLMDQGDYITMIINGVLQSMIVGAVLAILILALFLKDVKPTIVVAVSIPLSVLTALILMYFTGISLNMMSLSGLALGIGMLVDNSIVVIENIYRLRGEGYSIRKAAVEGASQVTGAITASTLTTVCVFAPIIFTEGITRQLFVDIALTIAFTLAASLLVALTFVPMMAAGLLKNTKEIRHNFFDKVKDSYGKILAVCLRFKPVVFIAVIVLLGTSVVAAFSRGYSFMDMNMETNQISATISAKEDQTLTFDELTEMADEVVEKALTIDGIETIGAMAGGSALSMMGSSSTDSISMYMILDEESEVRSADVIEQLDELTKDMDCEVTTDTSASDMTSLMGSGLTINVKGNDLDKLQKLAGEVAKVVENTEGTVDVDDGLDNTTPSFTISVDKEKAAKYGMTVAQVFQLVYGKMASSTSATTISTDVNEYQVYVQSEQQSDVTLDDIKNLTFTYTDREENETEVALSDIAQFEEGYTLGTISRDAQTRYISVTAGVDDDHNVSLLSNEIQKELDKIDLPEGYSIEMAGEDEMIADAMNQLYLMLLLAVIFIYLVMVAQFQSLLSPFIIMFTIPLAFTGGLFALYFTGNEVSVVAMIGFVMLAGIIVNNGIVMVDFINQLRRGGMEKKDAIIESGKTRLRPILMTALTTILSMSTMAVGLGEGSEMMQPMAIVTVGGLLYGTLLTLIVVPCIYDAFNRNKSMVEEDL